ncbi:hypothetical protein BTA51_10025 [Hahella sp. CCB-MM4]|uniref:hypothetical protein n=1 Tax=Hahella sp. (strain CCB-MM4) TaxID=1926491 RepID=UPI000B9BF7E0|nr:hypothetical protein [Hahella sp. CCB-MM4]OZG73361.1 hypothetical protein BTA51_10025 [Hahella sp. CCB-MM4]
MPYRILLKFFLISLLASGHTKAEDADKLSDWLDVVRNSPYAATKGFYENISDIRRWVLLGEGFCNRIDRHILFNTRGHFLGYLNNRSTSEQTQQALNQLRKKLVNEKKAKYWVEGTDDKVGYPFALACEQPHVDMKAALGRMLGDTPDHLVWGTWDGMTIGSRDAPLPLVKVVQQVYDQRDLQTGLGWSDILISHLLGQILIESGARKRSFSSADAVGLLQLRPEVLQDCRIPDKFQLHRMAQIDCALKLYRQNHRNLLPVFEKQFSHLPTDKKDKLYAMLLVQAYHGGIGRLISVLSDPELGAAARYYASHQERFPAEDIALGIIFHNLGRHELGLASLYYLIDVEIATESLCESKESRDIGIC